jgi:hypothetical protein
VEGPRIVNGIGESGIILESKVFVQPRIPKIPIDNANLASRTLGESFARSRTHPTAPRSFVNSAESDGLRGFRGNGQNKQTLYEFQDLVFGNIFGAPRKTVPRRAKQRRPG